MLEVPEEGRKTAVPSGCTRSSRSRLPRRDGRAGTAAGPRAGALLQSATRGESVVRRYRAEPTPLVRDAVRGYRTGRFDRVLAGDFDLF